jgi:hypothetical protein
MRYRAAKVTALSVFAVGGCGGSPQEGRAQQVEAAAKDRAEAIQKNARGAPRNVQEQAEHNAETTLKEAEIRAEAIRDSEGKIED